MVKLCFVPSGKVRLNFTWLPLWETTSKPKWENIPTTSLPLRILSFGIGWLELEADQDGEIGKDIPFL